MRALAVLIGVVIALPALADDTPRVWAGAELGVLMREEGGGNRTPLPALSGRVSYGDFGPASLTAVYQFAFGYSGNTIFGFAQHHRLQLRPTVSATLGAVEATLGLGPGVALVHSVVWSDAGDSFSTVYPRLLLGGEVALAVRLGGTKLRSSVDVSWNAGTSRVDFLVGLGAAFELGGQP